MGSFSMFDFTPVGLVVALVGWRLVSARKQTSVGGFESGAYITEVRMEKGSKAEGMSLREIETELDDVDAQVIGIVQKEVRLSVSTVGYGAIKP